MRLSGRGRARAAHIGDRGDEAIVAHLRVLDERLRLVVLVVAERVADEADDGLARVAVELEVLRVARARQRLDVLQVAQRQRLVRFERSLGVNGLVAVVAERRLAAQALERRLLAAVVLARRDLVLVCSHEGKTRTRRFARE
jgi:hypothetical protein